MMQIRNAALAMLLVLSSAGSALAEVKAYTGDINKGDFLLYASTLCPPIQTTPGIFGGGYVLTDDATGTVTLNSFATITSTTIPVDTTFAFGPGSFIFVSAQQTTSATPDQVSAAGSSTAPSGSVGWGVLTGFSLTGGTFCLSSPTDTCTNSGRVHGVTVPPTPGSPTYDLGTWNFDANGDFEAEPYIAGTGAGGTSNNQNELRGALQGPALPVLPLAGFGALGVALLTLGVRSVRKQK